MSEAFKGKMPIFAERLKALRGKTSQADFAEKVGISRPTVGFYESGDRIPDALTLKQIAEACGVTTDYLVGLSDNKTAENFEAGARFGLSDDALLHLEYFKTEHAHQMKKHPFRGQFLTSLDVLNRLLEEGDLQRICYSISALSLTERNRIKRSQELLEAIDRLTDEKKRLDPNYDPEEDPDYGQLWSDHRTENDYFNYSCWSVYKMLEQFSKEAIESVLDLWIERNEQHADNPEAR